MTNKLCIIMSLYKNDKLNYVKESIESTLDQSYNAFDFYIIYDGVVPEEIDTYIETIKDERLKRIKRSLNLGLAVSLNELLNIALPLNYEFIARMDADDISLKDRLMKQVNFLEDNPTVEICGTQAILINENSEKIGSKKVKTDVHFNDMIKACELIHPTVMFRASFFKKYGFYNENLRKSQDYDLWLRATNKNANIKNLDEELLKFRYELNLIKRRKEEQKDNIQIKKKYLKGFAFYKSIIPNLVILMLPEFVIKYLLSIKIKS